MNDLRITLVQADLAWHDMMENLHRLNNLISKIEKRSTDVIILPEMFTSGFTMDAKANSNELTSLPTGWLKGVAYEKKAAVCGSLIIKENNKYYNRLCWAQPDESLQYYDKRHLFSMAKENKTYTPGTRKLIVKWKGWRICPMVCYDLRFPVWSRRTQEEDYDLLLYVANWPERRIQAWKQLLIARAIENQSYVAGVNRVGKDGNGIVHTGESAAIDPMGNRISKMKGPKPGIETVVLEARPLNLWRRQMKAMTDADKFKLVV